MCKQAMMLAAVCRTAQQQQRTHNPNSDKCTTRQRLLTARHHKKLQAQRSTPKGLLSRPIESAVLRSNRSKDRSLHAIVGAITSGQAACGWACATKMVQPAAAAQLNTTTVSRAQVVQAAVHAQLHLSPEVMRGCDQGWSGLL